MYMDSRDKVQALLDLIDAGCLDARDVLGNVLTNYMSSDDANDFVESEYGEYFEDEDDDENDEWEEPAEEYSTFDDEND